MKINQSFLSDRAYIRQKAKSLPIVECLMEKDYKSLGITSVIIVRQEPGGKYTMGAFIVDLYCLGVKNVACKCHLTDKELERYQTSFDSGPMKISPAMAHNIIYGAVDYAREMNFEPHKDFEFAENVLDENLIDDGIDEIEFGKDGKPYYFQGPYDDPHKIVAHLNKYVGKGNYHFTLVQI